MSAPEAFAIGLPILLVFIGWVAGRASESRHLKALDQRERALRDMFVSDLRSFTGEVDRSRPVAMLVGEAVIATDYCKTLLARLRNIFGGEVRGYTTLVMRARREALLRLLEQAKAGGYNAICNVRLETADIGGNSSSGRGVPLAAVLASATAYRCRPGPDNAYRRLASES